ncbi:MAG: DegT/DnrJ/EryC1/StrS family aminotransferase [Pseudonocardiaceae bacterium]
MGLKHRITTLGAAIGLHQLGHTADIETHRRVILARYTTGGPHDRPVPRHRARRRLAAFTLPRAPPAGPPAEVRP